jgi:mRNA export factor
MSALFGGTSSAAATASTQGDLSKDVAMSDPPEDTVTDLAFSPTQDLLSISSWDKKVRIYEINSNGQSQGKLMYEHDAPVFSVDFSKVALSFPHPLPHLLFSSSSPFLYISAPFVADPL